MTDPLERVSEVPEGWYRENPVATSVLVDSFLAVAKAAEAEHKYVETVDGEGDDWTGCLCGEAACPILAALDSLRSTAKELM